MFSKQKGENMGKRLFIAEKPSVAQEFAKALHMSAARKDGYLEDDNNIVTWCVGHLVTLSYPEAYDENLKNWELETLPFLPEPSKYKYEVIKDVSKQFRIVKELLNRSDVSEIYYSGDSAREGEYIQRLVRQEAGHNPNAVEKRVWIDSQTEEEIIKGINQAKPLSAYDGLSEAAYARAIEDYAMGINFSRVLAIRYAGPVYNAAGLKRGSFSIGRVVSCVLGMIVDRERAIRNNIKTYYYTVSGNTQGIDTSWEGKEQSGFYQQEDLYNNIGFLKKEKADAFTNAIGPSLTYIRTNTKTEKKGAPLLFNLAELQSECTKLFHISPDETLTVAQSLYEKKLTTYPRTDARVLTTAIDKEIDKNISGLQGVPEVAAFASNILNNRMYVNIAHTKYTNDAAVSDHYAIIPTGNTSNLGQLSGREKDIYLLIARRFLSIFYPEAEYLKATGVFSASDEFFYTKVSKCSAPGWLEVAGKVPDNTEADNILNKLQSLTAGTSYPAAYTIKEASTNPPKRYTTGSIILAMENAGTLIEEEELREQIKGAGIGTSATRAETIKKLDKNGYISVNSKQVITPTALGEAIYEMLVIAAPSLLKPNLTASWEKGLGMIERGETTQAEYLAKLYDYITKITNSVKGSDYKEPLRQKLLMLGSVYSTMKADRMDDNNAGIKTYVCPHCGGEVLIGKFGPYCKDKCGMSFAYYGTAFKENELKKLIANEPIIKTGRSKEGKDYKYSLTPTGIVPYSYTNKNGETVNGFQWNFERAFINNKSQKQ